MPAMKIGVALSTHPDTVRGTREAARGALQDAGLPRATWAICFFTMAHLPRADALRKTLLHELGCEALSGCSAHGLVSGSAEVEDQPGITLLVGDMGQSPIKLRTALLPATGDGFETLLPLFEDASLDSKDRGVLFTLPDVYRVDARQLIAQIHAERPGTACFGGGSTDNGVTGMALQLGMEGVRSNSVAAFSLCGDLEVTVGITQSCSPVGEPRFVTAAEGNVLMELDGRPAIHVLIEQGKALKLDDFQKLVEELLLGFPVDSIAPRFTSDACLVRHLLGFDQQKGGIVVPDSLETQQAMIFMHRTAEQAERDMRRMVRDVAARLEGPPDLGLYFNCAARGKRLYGKEGVDTAIIRETLGEFPLIGMMGGFELATSVGYPLLYTYTGVLVLIRVR